MRPGVSAKGTVADRALRAFLDKNIAALAGPDSDWSADFGKAWKSGEHEAYEKEVNEKYEFAGVEPNNMDVNDVLGSV